MTLRGDTINDILIKKDTSSVILIKESQLVENNNYEFYVK